MNEEARKADLDKRDQLIESVEHVVLKCYDADRQPVAGLTRADMMLLALGEHVMVTEQMVITAADLLHKAAQALQGTSWAQDKALVAEIERWLEQLPQEVGT
jgi:hypothetical protein